MIDATHALPMNRHAEVLAHRVSSSMSTDLCVEALEEAIAKYGRTEIFKTDQSSQFTSTEVTDVLTATGIRISMDSPGPMARPCVRRVAVEQREGCTGVSACL